MTGVAISGRAGSGKTTLAHSLDDHGFTRIAFGDALKQEVFELYGLSKLDPGGREKLIEHGDRMRAADPDYWIRPVAEKVRLAQVCGLPVVIDDVRFVRELYWAREVGFKIVRIDAPLALRRARLAVQGLDPDFAETTGPGETELEGHLHRWDYYVWNVEPGECFHAAHRIATALTAGPSAVAA